MNTDPYKNRRGMNLKFPEENKTFNDYIKYDGNHLAPKRNRINRDSYEHKGRFA